MDQNNYSEIISTCKKFFRQDSNLWIQTLQYFSKKDDNCKEYIVDILNYIDKYDLLPPIVVIKILSQNNNNLSFDSIRVRVIK